MPCVYFRSSSVSHKNKFISGSFVVIMTFLQVFAFAKCQILCMLCLIVLAYDLLTETKNDKMVNKNKLISQICHSTRYEGYPVNPNKPNGLSYPCTLGEFICHLRGVRCIFFLFVLFVIEISVSKQCRPWSDTTRCGVWSRSALSMSHNGTPGLYRLILFLFFHKKTYIVGTN